MENFEEDKFVKPKKSKLWLIAPVLVIFGSLIGALITFIVMEYNFYSDTSSVYQKMSTLKYILDKEYLYEYDDEELSDYAAYAMTMALGDKYSAYYPKDEFLMLSNESNGDFVGIGIVVVADYEEDKIIIESVEAGSPAERAGVLAGDVLAAVDGEKALASNFADTVYRTRGFHLEGGSVGKSVAISVLRGDETLEFNIVREKLHTDSVTSKMQTKEIGYISISGFKGSDGEHKDTYEEFSEHFKNLENEGMKKLIIDVRNNGGGELDSVSKIIDMIVPKGTIMYAQYKDGQKDYLYSDENEINIPMAVLVNGNSASAAELLTGALKDYNKAEIVGTTTYGKGVMQQVFPLGDGSGLIVTVAKYYTPDGTCVEETGIEPDYVVEQSSATEDLQLLKAIEILQ